MVQHTVWSRNQGLNESAQRRAARAVFSSLASWSKHLRSITAMLNWPSPRQHHKIGKLSCVQTVNTERL